MLFPPLKNSAYRSAIYKDGRLVKKHPHRKITGCYQTAKRSEKTEKELIKEKAIVEMPKKATAFFFSKENTK